ncbi:MBL fold metallo-hydrolase [Roseateles chitinivorans]|uniref:MBL fold metallo-hydrolase n=1 Tax=Roseateles chitinivorans TaxID=2917965 RepID=UPI003D675FE3
MKTLNQLAAVSALLMCMLTVAAAQDVSGEKLVDTSQVSEVRPGVYVVEDRHQVLLVPNVTIIVGRDAALVVDTGLGPDSGRRVLSLARRLAGTKRLYLTTTHFHPEHGFGAQVFKGQATIIYNRSQWDELNKKGSAYRKLFSEQLGVAHALKDVEFVPPDIIYEREAQIDLGGRLVRLESVGPAHTLGDQVVSVPSEGVVILGDLFETNSFPIMPWFPQIQDTDVDPIRWRAIFRSVEQSAPTVVIPGHGRIGALADLQAAAEHLDFVSKEVSARCAAGQDLAAMQSELTPILKAQHPGWDLSNWIAGEIQVFHRRLCSTASTQ